MFTQIPNQRGSHDGLIENCWRYIYEVDREPDALEAESAVERSDLE